MDKKIKITMGIVAFVLLISLGIWKIYTTFWIHEQQNEKQNPIETNEDTVTLDWYTNYSWFSTHWGGNMVSDTITDRTGVNINFMTPQGNETEKLNALIASDSLPDIITMGFWEPQVSDMIQKGMLYPLNELADEYDPAFWEVTNKDVVNWYTNEDGNIYTYPNSAVTPEDVKNNSEIPSNQTFLVRKDIYEAIGSPDMTTTEGFLNAVKKAVQMYPEVNGQSLIPVGAYEFTDYGNDSFDQFIMNFLAVPYEEDGALYDRNTDQEYLKWLSMFRELNEEGYLANEIFVDSRTQMEENIVEGRYFCMFYQYTDMMTQQKKLFEKNPDQIYIAVEGPRNSNGDCPTLPSSGISGWTLTMISKNCKDPEKAMKLIDYMMSEEGQKIIYLGIEGKTYDMVDGKPVVKKEVKDILDTNRVEYDRLYGADNTYWMLQNTVMQQQWEQEPSPAIAQLLEWSSKYTVYNGQYSVYFPSGTVEAQTEDQIGRLWGHTLTELLLASSQEEFDQIVENYVSERAKMGYDSYMKKKYEKVKEAEEKLGIADE